MVYGLTMLDLEGAYPHLDVMFLMVDAWKRLMWELMRPYAILMLVLEIKFGVMGYIENNRRLWDTFPVEMDVLRRMRLEERARRIGCVLTV